MKKLIIFVALCVALTVCGSKPKPIESFPHNFVETIEVERIEVEEIIVK